MAKTKYIHREIEEVLKKRVKQFPCLVLTGPRQTGKSTLLQHTFPSFNYTSLDSPVLREIALKDPIAFLENISRPAIIDEIQYAPNLLPYIKILVDENRSRRGQFILTGSQFFPLMEGISETLAGRISINELLGFSIREIPPKKTRPIDCFSLLFKGWFPEPALGIVDSPAFYEAYIQTYLERDLRQVSAIKDLLLFQTFLELLAGRSGTVLNLSEIAKDVGVSHTTAQNWLSILASARIVYLLRPFFKNIPKRAIKRPKIYFTDTGLVTHLLRYPSPEALFKGTMKGPIFETFVVMEVLKYKLNHQLSFELFFFQDSNHNEVDLIVEMGDKFILIEIKATATPTHNHIKELKKLGSLFKNPKMFLVSLYPEKIKLDKDITNIPWHRVSEVLFS